MHRNDVSGFTRLESRRLWQPFIRARRIVRNRYDRGTRSRRRWTADVSDVALAADERAFSAMRLRPRIPLCRVVANAKA